MIQQKWQVTAKFVCLDTKHNT